ALLGDAGQFVGAGGVDQQRQLVEVGLFLCGRPPREHHADEHDALAEGSLDEAHATSMVAISSEGPVRITVSPDRSTSDAPPGWWTVTLVPTLPHAWTAADAAQAPLPQARVSPTPRSQTRIVISSRPGPSATNSTFMPPGWRASISGPSSATAMCAGSGPSSTRCGFPMSTVRRPASTLQAPSVPSTNRAGPMSTLTQC